MDIWLLDISNGWRLLGIFPINHESVPLDIDAFTACISSIDRANLLAIAKGDGPGRILSI